MAGTPHASGLRQGESFGRALSSPGHAGQGPARRSCLQRSLILIPWGQPATTENARHACGFLRTATAGVISAGRNANRRPPCAPSVTRNCSPSRPRPPSSISTFPSPSRSAGTCWSRYTRCRSTRWMRKSGCAPNRRPEAGKSSATTRPASSSRPVRTPRCSSPATRFSMPATSPVREPTPNTIWWTSVSSAASPPASTGRRPPPCR